MQVYAFSNVSTNCRMSQHLLALLSLGHKGVLAYGIGNGEQDDQSLNKFADKYYT